MFKRSRLRNVISAESIIFGVIYLVVLILLIGFLNDTADSSLEEGRRIAEDSLSRAAVSCYAFEGVYPTNYEYLSENYGVHIDTDKYVVHYISYGSGLMPDIGVYVKSGNLYE